MGDEMGTIALGVCVVVGELETVVVVKSMGSGEGD